MIGIHFLPPLNERGIFFCNWQRIIYQAKEG